VPVRRAEGPAAVDVVALPQREHLRADQPGGRRPRGDPDHEDDVLHRRAEDRGEHDRQGQKRDHEEPLGEAHEHPAGAPAEEAGGDADHRADQHGEDGRGQADDQADARAPDELREHVAAEAVGSERAELGGARESRVVRRVDRLQALGVGQQRGGQGHRHHQHEDREADHPGPVAAVLAPGARHGAPAAQPGDPARRGDGDRVHDVRTRGSRYA
jgi:hypothetical protein